MYVLTFSYTFSNRGTCHDRHETDSYCFIWYVKVCEKDFYLVFSTKLAFNSHFQVRFTIIDNFYTPPVDSDLNFLCHNKWDLQRTEFCGNK